MFLVRGEKADSKQVVIVDIDEKSLTHLGQWPWNRDKFAKILENLTRAEVGVIGLDIVFAEVDSTSPHTMAKKYKLKEELPNYDAILAETLSQTPTILGYQFELNDKQYHKNKEAPIIPAIIIERNKQLGIEYLVKANGVVSNHKVIQEMSYSSGFFNNLPDESGIVRSVPMIIEYKGQLYPTLTLEMLRAALGMNKVYVNYSSLGVENIEVGEYKIPTDRHGRMIVNFRGGEGSFKYLSASDIYFNTFNPKDIAGKIVLIGTTAAGLNDLRAIPYQSIYPGVEVHANIIDNILTKDFISMPSWIDGLDYIVIFGLAIFTFFLMTYSPFWMNPFLIAMSGFIYLSIAYYLLFSKGILIDLALPIVVIFSSGLIATFMDYVLEVKNEQNIKKKFASKVSLEVMEDILKEENDNKFSAKEKEVTIFFSDVRGFTKISETLDNPNLLIALMNEYMTPMTKIITEYHGTIDKFIGDAIMAYWNAPSDVKNHQDKAVQAALKQIQYLDTLNVKLNEDSRFNILTQKIGEDIIDIGIGLNTGLAVVGEMGSETRSDYTVIGDSVNLASRVESLCKMYGVKCMISNYVKEGLKESYIIRLLDRVRVKGKTEPVQLFEVIDFGNYLNDEIQKELDMHYNALLLYYNEQFEEALEIFEELYEFDSDISKKVYELYIERCEEYMNNPPEDFDGITTLNTKG